MDTASNADSSKKLAPLVGVPKMAPDTWAPDSLATIQSDYGALKAPVYNSDGFNEDFGDAFPKLPDAIWSGTLQEEGETKQDPPDRWKDLALEDIDHPQMIYSHALDLTPPMQDSGPSSFDRHADCTVDKSLAYTSTDSAYYSYEAARLFHCPEATIESCVSAGASSESDTEAGTTNRSLDGTVNFAAAKAVSPFAKLEPHKRRLSNSHKSDGSADAMWSHLTKHQRLATPQASFITEKAHSLLSICLAGCEGTLPAVHDLEALSVLTRLPLQKVTDWFMSRLPEEATHGESPTFSHEPYSQSPYSQQAVTPFKPELRQPEANETECDGLGATVRASLEPIAIWNAHASHVHAQNDGYSPGANTKLLIEDPVSVPCAGTTPAPGHPGAHVSASDRLLSSHPAELEIPFVTRYMSDAWDTDCASGQIETKRSTPDGRFRCTSGCGYRAKKRGDWEKHELKR